jgi:hypothetical protein
MRHGNCDVEVEAVLVLLGVRVPHFGARKSGKHAVHNLDARVRLLVSHLYSAPAEIEIVRNELLLKRKQK